MLTIAGITLKRLREPAFFLLLLISICAGYFMSGMESVASQISSVSLLIHLVYEKSRYQPVLASSLLAFFVSLMLACFSGAAEIPRDIATGQVQFLLTKPISRTSYMCGKYLGILATCLVFFTLIEISIVVFYYLAENTWYSFPMILRQFQLTIAFIPCVAVIVALSCFVGDIAAIILTVLYLMFSMLFNFIPVIISMLPPGVAAEVSNGIYVLYYLFPNLIYYFIDHNTFGFYSLVLCIYSVSVAVIFLMIAAYRLNHMDLTRKG